MHAKGGLIVAQLWHTGRISQPSFGEHPLLKASGRPLPSVSASAAVMAHPRTGKPLRTATYAGVEECAVPRALGTGEVARVVEDYRHAARTALRAGFDGVELHAAHGYLVDQFLQDGVNQRTDRYGGTVANRCRFLFEAVEALCGVMGPGRVGVRLSPTTIDPATGRQSQVYFAAQCSDPDAVYAHAVSGLNAHPLAYLLLTEPRWSGRDDGDFATDKGFSQPLSNHKYREMFDGTLMAAGGFTPASAAAAIRDGHYDMVAFGRWFISNPDLPARIRSGGDLNVYQRDTFCEDGPASCCGAEPLVRLRPLSGLLTAAGAFRHGDRRRRGRVGRRLHRLPGRCGDGGGGREVPDDRAGEDRRGARLREAVVRPRGSRRKHALGMDWHCSPLRSRGRQRCGRRHGGPPAWLHGPPCHPKRRQLNKVVAPGASLRRRSRARLNVAAAAAVPHLAVAA